MFVIWSRGSAHPTCLSKGCGQPLANPLPHLFLTNTVQHVGALGIYYLSCFRISLCILLFIVQYYFIILCYYQKIGNTDIYFAITRASIVLVSVALCKKYQEYTWTLFIILIIRCYEYIICRFAPGSFYHSNALFDPKCSALSQV